MADTSEGITYVFDENSIGLLTVFRSARVDRDYELSDLPTLGIPAGTLDVPLLKQLGTRGAFALIARDGKMLDPIVQRQAWKESGVTLFLLSKAWGQLSLMELSRRLLFLWPTLTNYARDGGRGVAWRVNPTIPHPNNSAFRLVTGRHADNP